MIIHLILVQHPKTELTDLIIFSGLMSWEKRFWQLWTYILFDGIDVVNTTEGDYRPKIKQVNN